MASNIDPPDRDRVLEWVHNGALESDYPKIKPILDSRCATCHSAQSGMPIPPIDSYAAVQKLAETDQGPTITDLARVSHVHLFGISIFFLLTGAIFALSRITAWLRVTIVVLPYLAIIADIGSWWLTKFFPIFGVVVVIGGALMVRTPSLRPRRKRWKNSCKMPPLRQATSSSRICISRLANMTKRSQPIIARSIWARTMPAPGPNLVNPSSWPATAKYRRRRSRHSPTQSAWIRMMLALDFTLAWPRRRSAI